MIVGLPCTTSTSTCPSHPCRCSRWQQMSLHGTSWTRSACVWRFDTSERRGCAPRGRQCSARHERSGVSIEGWSKTFVVGQPGSVRDGECQRCCGDTSIRRLIPLWWTPPWPQFPTPNQHEVEPEPAGLRMTPEFQDVLASFDVDLQSVFRRRACVMKSCPKFLVGHFRAAMRLAIANSGDELRFGSCSCCSQGCYSTDHPGVDCCVNLSC